MVKIKQSPKLPADERRMQLLMAAQKLFGMKGYKETTTNEIAREADLTKGALYFHFKNKEDILYELVKHVFEHFLTKLEENEENLNAPDAFLDVFCPCHQDEGHHELTSNLDFWVQAMSIPKIKRLMITKFEKMSDFFIKNVDAKYAKSKKEMYQLAVLTFSIVDGLHIRQIMDPENTDMNMIIRMFSEMNESRAARLKRKKAKK